MEISIILAKMSKKKLAKILRIVSLALVVIAMAIFAASMYTVTKTLRSSLFVEGVEEPIQIDVLGDPIKGTLEGVASLRVVGEGLMSTNVSATVEILDIQGNVLFSVSNSTMISPGEVKYLTMRFSLSGIDIRTLNASLRLRFRAFFNLIGVEFSTGFTGRGD